MNVKDKVKIKDEVRTSLDLPDIEYTIKDILDDDKCLVTLDDDAEFVMCPIVLHSEELGDWVEFFKRDELITI